MTVLERVAYIQGMFDGLGLDKESSKEAKIMAEMLEVLRDVGVELDALADDVSELDDALSDVDDFGFGDIDDDDDEDECGCGCGHRHGHGQLYNATCPNCGEQLVIDESILEAGTITCPACKDKFAVSLEDDDVEEIDGE